MPTEIAIEMVARSQCRSFSSGTSSTPGMDRTPAEISNDRKMAAATTQA